jgi:flagellar biosynthetic protein FliO
VAELKKKIFVFLITVVLGGGLLVVCSAGSATNEKESEKSQLDTSKPKSAIESNKNSSLFANDPNFFGRSDYNPGSGELWIKAVYAVLLVFVLIVAVVYVSRKLLPKITNMPGKEIRIIETAHLGPRKTVHVIDVRGRRLLIGSTNENITKLADLSSDLTDLSSIETNYN